MCVFYYLLFLVNELVVCMCSHGLVFLSVFVCVCVFGCVGKVSKRALFPVLNSAGAAMAELIPSVVFIITFCVII